MAAQVKLLALQVMADEGFVLWIQGIGEKGQKQLQDLFVKTALSNELLAAMAQEDPQSAMMIFAYQVYQQSTEKGNTTKSSATPQLVLDMNGAPSPTPLPLQNNTYPTMAKLGAKLDYISNLNGHCPAGYEVEKYLAGGCVKCRKGKQLQKSLTEELKCGGKKRINKGSDGTIISKKTLNGITKTVHEGPDDYVAKVRTTSYVDTKTGTGHQAYQEAGRKDSTFTSRKDYYKMEDRFNGKKASKKEDGGLLESFKCGGKKRIKKAQDGNLMGVGNRLEGNQQNSDNKYIIKAKKNSSVNVNIPTEKCGAKVKKNCGGASLLKIKK